MHYCSVVLCSLAFCIIICCTYMSMHEMCPCNLCSCLPETNIPFRSYHFDTDDRHHHTLAVYHACLHYCIHLCCICFTLFFIYSSMFGSFVYIYRSIPSRVKYVRPSEKFDRVIQHVVRIQETFMSAGVSLTFRPLLPALRMNC